MPAKLYGVPGSHPTAAAQRALELKGVPFQRIDLLPVFHKAAQRARFGRSPAVPGVVFSDGAKVMGSRAIMRALDERVPEPPLLPAERRAEIEAAEAWGDEVLQSATRRIVWAALSRKPAAQMSFLEGVKLFPPAPRPVARLSASGVAWAERRLNRVTEDAVGTDLRELPAHLDRVDGWIADGLLGGERLNAADLQIASSVRLLMALDDLDALISPRPCAEHARTVFPRWTGRVPSGALPSA